MRSCPAPRRLLRRAVVILFEFNRLDTGGLRNPVSGIVSVSGGRAAAARPVPWRDRRRRAGDVRARCGVAAQELNAAFSPAGDELFFTLADPARTHDTLLRMVRGADGVWDGPEVAPFSGLHADADPLFSDDGQRLYFISKRPRAYRAVPAGGATRSSRWGRRSTARRAAARGRSSIRSWRRTRAT